MNNAINTRCLASTPAEIFAAVVRDAGNCGCLPAVLEAIETEAALIRRSDPKSAAVIDAALSFIEGFDQTATETLLDSDINGAARIVRRMKILFADNADKFYLPRRSI